MACHGYAATPELTLTFAFRGGYGMIYVWGGEGATI